MQHVPAGELVPTELGDTLDRDTHASELAHINHSYCLTVHIPDVLHHAEQHGFVRVPVDFPEVHNPDGSEVVYEFRRHPDFLPHDVLWIVIPDGCDGEHGLVCQITICIIKNLFVAFCELAAVFLHPKIDVGYARHLGEYKILVILRLCKIHLRSCVIEDPGMEFIAEEFVISVFGATLIIPHGICVLRTQPGGYELNILRIDQSARVIR